MTDLTRPALPLVNDGFHWEVRRSASLNDYQRSVLWDASGQPDHGVEAPYAVCLMQDGADTLIAIEPLEALHPEDIADRAEKLVHTMRVETERRERLDAAARHLVAAEAALLGDYGRGAPVLAELTPAAWH